MKRNILIFSMVLLFACYGEDNMQVQMRLQIPLNTKDIGDVNSDGSVSSIDRSLDTNFALANVVLKGTVSGEQEFLLDISYSSAKLGTYYFDTVISASLGEEITISFSGYYYINDNTIGGFVSPAENMLQIREGMDNEVQLESIDIPRCEVTVNILDRTVTEIIFYDFKKDIFLKTFSKSQNGENFIVNIPEGNYDLYNVGKLREKKLIKSNVEIKGNKLTLEI